MAEAIKSVTTPPMAAAPCAAQPAPQKAEGVQPMRDAFEADADNFDDAARLVLAGIAPPSLPEVQGPFAPRGTAAGVALDGLAYRQRHLAEAIHILTELAGARMDASGRAKVRHARNETTAALQAAELELKSARAGRQAAWTSAVSGALSAGATASLNPTDKFWLGVLGQALTVLDKNYGFQRTVDDATWQKSYITVRERLSKQMEDMQGNEYEKAIRLLERSLETTRQMASNNTDTVRSVSQNL